MLVVLKGFLELCFVMCVGLRLVVLLALFCWCGVVYCVLEVVV